MWGYFAFVVKAIAIEARKLQRGPDGHSYRVSAVDINQLKDAMEPLRSPGETIESVFSIQVYNDPMASIDDSNFCVLNLIDGSRMLVLGNAQGIRTMFDKPISAAYEGGIYHI